MASAAPSGRRAHSRSSGGKPAPRWSRSFLVLFGAALACTPRPAAAPASRATWSFAAVLGDAGGVTLEGGVVAATFSADDRFVAVGGGGVEVLEVPSRRRVRVLRDTAVRGDALALSRDGALVAVPGHPYGLEIFSVKTGARVDALTLDAPAQAAAFAPAADLLAVGGDDLTLALYDMTNRRYRWRKRAPVTGEVQSLAFSRDGEFLLSGSSASAGDDWTESPRLWRVTDGVQIRSFDHSLSLTAWSADGRRVASSGGSQIWIWDRESGRDVAMLRDVPEASDGRVIGVALSRDGARAHSLTRDGTLTEWDVARERALRRARTGDGAVSAFAVSPDGRHAVSGARDGRVRMWDLPKLAEVPSGRGHTGSVAALALDKSRPGSPRLRSAGQDGRVLDWALDGSGVPLAESAWRSGPAPDAGQAPRLSFAPNGGALLARDQERVVAVDPGSGRKSWQLQFGEEVWPAWPSVAASSKGGLVALPSSSLLLLDLATGRVRARLPSEPRADFAILSPALDRLALGTSEGELWLADATTGAVLRRFAGHGRYKVFIVDEGPTWLPRSPVHAGAFRPDGAVLLTIGADQAVRFWDTASGRALGAVALPHDRFSPDLVAFSADGTVAAVARNDGHLFVLDTVRFRLIAPVPLDAHPALQGARPRALVFGTDASTLYVGTNQGTIGVLRGPKTDPPR